MTDRFAEFFTHKITKICNDLSQMRDYQQDLHLHEQASPDKDDDVTSSLSEFIPDSEAEIRTLVVQSPSKSCGLDPLTTWLLKDNLDVLLPTLIQIVNSSMSSGNVSDSLKEALVTPLLKKNNLDLE